MTTNDEFLRILVFALTDWRKNFTNCCQIPRPEPNPLSLNIKQQYWSLDREVRWVVLMD